jgi:signal transduction histidine kinase
MFIAWLSVVLLLAAWLVDMFTPQALVAAILLAIPVALASVFLERRFTSWMVGSALVANAVAGWFNGMREGGHWDSIAIANRMLAAFSVILVGVLGNIAQSAAEQSGRLTARQRQSERAERVRRAFERIRSTLNVDLVARAVVREAVVTLGADAASLVMLEGGALGDVEYAYGKDDADVAVRRASPTVGLPQFARRAAETRDVVTLAPTDPVARLCLDALGADHARIVPLSDSRSAVAVLILSMRSPATDDPEPDLFFRSFGEQAGVAIAQATVFVELARKNEELAAANRAIAERGDVIREIVYALSHDLRTPLAAAAMTLQQALDGKYGQLPEAYREILRRSIESNDELRRLAETLLVVAKYESGEQSTTRAPVRLGALARNVVNELEPLWHAKAIKMRVVDDETAVASGDDGELRRAVMNLLANAITWTPENGTITILIRHAGNDVSVVVADDGYGVPSAERAHLFERDRTKTPGRAGAGSGLGLYIVRRIAQSHGGTATYHPREPRGSEFSLTLPAVAEVPAHG